MRTTIKFFIALLFLILFSSCEKDPTSPPILPEDEITKIPFDRLTGKIAFRRIVQDLPDEYYLILIDAQERSLTNKALFYPYVPANFQFSPNGNQILFSYYVLKASGYFQWQLYLTDLTDLSVQNISPSYYDDTFGTWSPDGKKVAFWSNRNMLSAIWLQEIGADSAQMLIRVKQIARTRPAWTPDGQNLIVSSMDTVGHAILLNFNLGNSDIDTLFTSAEDSNSVVYKHLALAQDGERIALVKAQLNGIDEIWIFNLVNKSRTRLTTGHADWHPCWSPDGSQILFSRGQSLFIIRDDGTDLEQVSFGEHNFDEYPTWIKIE